MTSLLAKLLLFLFSLFSLQSLVVRFLCPLSMVTPLLLQMPIAWRSYLFVMITFWHATVIGGVVIGQVRRSSLHYRLRRFTSIIGGRSNRLFLACGGGSSVRSGPFICFWLFSLCPVCEWAEGPSSNTQVGASQSPLQRLTRFCLMFGLSHRYRYMYNVCLRRSTVYAKVLRIQRCSVSRVGALVFLFECQN